MQILRGKSIERYTKICRERKGAAGWSTAACIVTQYLDPRSNWTPGPNFTVVFGPPNKHERNALVGQFVVFLGRVCEFVNLG